MENKKHLKTNLKPIKKEKNFVIKGDKIILGNYIPVYTRHKIQYFREDQKRRLPNGSRLFYAYFKNSYSNKNGTISEL